MRRRSSCAACCTWYIIKTYICILFLSPVSQNRIMTQSLIIIELFLAVAVVFVMIGIRGALVGV